MREARAELEALREAARGRERELDLLQFQLDEIESVDPSAGESEELASEEGRLAHVERLTEHASAAEHGLSGEGGIGDAPPLPSRPSWRRRRRWIPAPPTSRPAPAPPPPSSPSWGATCGTTASRSSRSGPAPGRAERIGTLKQLQRKYGSTDADVLVFLAETSARLATLEGADDRIGALDAEVETLAGQAADRAATVTAGRPRRGRLAPGCGARSSSSRDAGGGVRGPSRSAGGARHHRSGARGAVVLPDPRQPVRPVAKAASGGELSRVMLACRSVLADLDDVGTLVFDEIDAGIGGQAGLAVGRRLARLAAGRQVLVVTHLPQIACFADRHLRVSKEAGAASVEVRRRRARRRAFRMLAGLPGSERGVARRGAARGGRVSARELPRRSVGAGPSP